jgi:hypothetical protein
VIETLSLAALVERFADGLEILDGAFTRTLAAALDAHRDRIRLPTVERLGLGDVVVTFRMDRIMALVVTGTLPEGPGEVTLRFAERDFPEIAVELGGPSTGEAYLFATLDHGWRGRRGQVGDEGETVDIRALTTVGAEISWRVQGKDGATSIPLGDLTLLSDDSA